MDYQFVACLLAIVFGDAVLEMSSAFGTVANNSGARHKALCTEKRLFVEGIDIILLFQNVEYYLHICEFQVFFCAV